MVKLLIFIFVEKKIADPSLFDQLFLSCIIDIISTHENYRIFEQKKKKKNYRILLLLI